ncbi:MAG: HAMP domain-containing histidine kinase [Vicinamibacteria bacterium]|nr:HAMP domain-containing histidine kinase [Vicinamibacteria bacterium]
MILGSIRWRLQVWHGVILVLVLAGFGATAYQVAWQGQLRRIDQDLERHLVGVFRPRTRTGLPDRVLPDPRALRSRLTDAIRRAESGFQAANSAYYFAMWDGEGSLTASSSSLPDDVPAPQHEASRWRDRPPPGKPDFIGEPPVFGAGRLFAFRSRSRGGLREVYQCFPDGVRLLIGRSIESERATMRRLAYGLSAAGGGVLLFGLLGGFWLANRAIRPIDDISSTAARIAAGDLSQRISVAGAENELGRLAGVLNATFARLDAAFSQQAKFTSDASHELRTPLAVILAQTQTALSRERDASEYRRALEACERAARHMRGLTDSLLDLACLDAGEEPMRLDRFDLAAVGRECLEMVRPLGEARGLVLRSDLPATPCAGDSKRIAQVMMNLLTNAIDFNRPGGEVEIRVHGERNRATFTVADTGAGIDEADLPHIFERFYRVDRSRSGAQGRTGLGLAICKAIVDAHGGTISAESKRDAGSRFTVKLPLKG